MGYKADIRNLQTSIANKNKKLGMLYSMLKQIVLEYGTQGEDGITLEIDTFEPQDNDIYVIDIDASDDLMHLTVRKREEE